MGKSKNPSFYELIQVVCVVIFIESIMTTICSKNKIPNKKETKINKRGFFYSKLFIGSAIISVIGSIYMINNYEF